MDASRALEIVSVLADGFNPFTGEELPNDSLYQEPDTIRALLVAVRALEGRVDRDRKRRNLPANTGSPWTSEEESRLLERFDDGASISQLAKEMERTAGGIEARLEKLGKIEPRTHRLHP